MRIQNVGKDQQSLDKIGKSMSGSDVVIAPNILEEMANKSTIYPQHAHMKSSLLQSILSALVPLSVRTGYALFPMLKASFAAQGLDYQPCGVVIHEDGSVTYIGILCKHLPSMCLPSPLFLSTDL